ncbi:MAG: hypothetical protein ABIF77_17030 [bacterium]
MGIDTTLRKRWVLLGLTLLIVLALVPNVLASRYFYESEVLLEGGVALPGGDLVDDWTDIEKQGFGAETGYEVGLRYRQFVSPNLALSPSFHYVDFGNFATETATQGAIIVATSILRYGLDVQYFTAAGQGRPQLFLSGGAALCRNRYRDDSEISGVYTAPVNALCFAAGGGIRLGDFEVGAYYNINRFDSVRLDYQGRKLSYNWDYLVVRAALAFPTH